MIMRMPCLRWIGYGLLLLGSTALAACRPAQPPDDLVGYWITDQTRYKGCYMIIDVDAVTLGNADLITAAGEIQRVSQKVEPDRRLIQIDFLDPQAGAQSLKLVSKSNQKRMLWFENQPDVLWKLASLPCAGS